MNALIKIIPSTIGSDEVNSVNARDLWAALDSKQKFADWIKDRLSDFTEGVDYTPLRNSMNRPQGGGVASIDYIITTDMAKHLCMMEHTDKGKEVRSYFIDRSKSNRGQWHGMASYAKSGYLLHHAPHCPANDNRASVVFTSKGLTWLWTRWAKAQQRIREANATDLIDWMDNM